MSANPQTQSGTPGMPSYALPDVMAFPDGAPGSVTDAQYLADEAGLRQQINAQYQDLLGQLGYIDPVSGAFIPGSVEQAADIQQGNLGQQMQQADQQVDQNAQNNGILFSGVRGTQRAQAEMPYLQQVGQLGFDTTNTLTDLYRQAQGLMGTYTTENQKLLADAAARAAAAATANPVDTGTPPPTPAPQPSVQTAVPNPLQLTGSGPMQAGPTGTDITPAANPGGSSTASGSPDIAFAKGGEISEPTHALLGENSSPGNIRSHEVVIPRNKLSKEGNSMLDHLMSMAGIKHAAMSRLGLGHPDPMNAGALRQAGLTQAAAALWTHRHPYAVGHDMIPDWVTVADHTRGHGGGFPTMPGGNFPDGLPPTPVLPTAHIHYPDQPMPPGGFQEVARMAHHNLAHQIGLAALRRLGHHDPGGFGEPMFHPQPMPQSQLGDAIHAIMPPSPLQPAPVGPPPPVPAFQGV